ncbi:hypothetical protein HNY73_003332 [Argiope bruennichi]|uniref:DNA-directed DNA polymerase n=1 Tax=Argiope bruennichi TaxID=94029 RepID=A0A8T0FZ60_ARGBR|nr:hypothetical protein HNY73_003332 [Argiope bruennichi]
MDSKACACVSNAYDLFTVMPVQLQTDESSFTESFPVASLSDKTPIEFFCSGVGDSYLDLAHTLLHLQVKITKKSGSNIAAPDQVAPINYLLNTLFSECSVTLNDKQVSSQANYAYRCMFDVLLSPKAVQESLLTAGLFFRDTPGKMDSIDILAGGESFKTRSNICKDSKLIDMIGALHFDLGNQNDDNRNLLKRKGVFPYSFLDDISKLDAKTFPSKDKYFNVLTQNRISDDDYSHAKLVYDTFGCARFEDYLKLYQRSNCVLRSEMFANFRKLSLNHYGLDPVHYISLSELTFDAGLKKCKIELQLLSNVNDYLFFENQMRGGICLVGKRYAKANNPYMSDSYDSSVNHSYILALDCVNLYGFAMSMPLPYANFSWMTPDEIQSFDIFGTTPDSPQGYILEVDLEIPTSLHDEHNDLPMVPEH